MPKILEIITRAQTPNTSFLFVRRPVGGGASFATTATEEELRDAVAKANNVFYNKDFLSGKNALSGILPGDEPHGFATAVQNNTPRSARYRLSDEIQSSAQGE